MMSKAFVVSNFGLFMFECSYFAEWLHCHSADV